MLHKHERQMLQEIEREIDAADPDFSASMRTGQQRLPHSPKSAFTRSLRNCSQPRRMWAVIGPLLVLVALLLVLGLPGSALTVSGLAAVVWLMRHCL
jgi:hypothetical protein